MNSIEGTVLVDALIALRNDELEPHDTLECIGWRAGYQLQVPFGSSVNENAICEALRAQGLLERKDDLYRITEAGVKAAMVYARDPANFRSQERVMVSDKERMRQLRVACEPLAAQLKPGVEVVTIPASLVIRIMGIMGDK